MAESDSVDEWRARVEEIDARSTSPSEHAKRIWNKIQQAAPDETDWAVLCFAAEFTGMMCASYPWLEDVAKPLAVRIYTAHYAKEGLYGPRISSTFAPQPEHRGADTSGEPKENSSGLILASGIFGRGRENTEAPVHLPSNLPQSSESSSSQATGDDECRGTGGDEGRND